MHQLHNDLLETNCGQFLTKRSISHQTGAQPPSAPICLDSSLNIQEGSTALATHRISSAPVYDQQQGGFIGMLDYRDLAAYVLEVFHKIPKTGTHNFNATMVIYGLF
jgi:predicted transcriptional regulator